MKHPLSRRFLNNIRSNDITAYRDTRLEEGKAASTITNEMNLVSQLYKTSASEWGMEALRNPVVGVQKPKKPPGRDRRLQPGEEASLLDRADYPLDSLIPLAIETAMREGELLGLKWEYVNMTDRIIHLPDTKNDEARDIPLSLDALAVFQALENNRVNSVSSPRVFPGLSSSNVSHRFLALCEQCGISNLHFHDLRHKAVSRLFEKGLNVAEVALTSGHKTLNMLMRYTHLKAKDIVSKLD